jgi:ankyrin repeat protein
MAKRHNASAWHWVVGPLECVPLLGGIVALIEYALFRYKYFAITQPAALTLFEERSFEINPFLNIKSFKDLLASKSSLVSLAPLSKKHSRINYSSPLYWAIKLQIPSLIDTALKSHDLNESYLTPRPEFCLEYPLQTAVFQGRYAFTCESVATAHQIILKLLELNANINQADEEELTPLHNALLSRQYSLVKLLFKEGGTLNTNSLTDELLRILAYLYYELEDELSTLLKQEANLNKDLCPLVLRYLF